MLAALLGWGLLAYVLAAYAGLAGETHRRAAREAEEERQRLEHVRSMSEKLEAELEGMRRERKKQEADKPAKEQ
jgi:hypothetical protein